MSYAKKHFIDGKNKLQYYIIGSGKPILLLHGAGVNALTYRDALAGLSKEHMVITPDMPCFGKSSSPTCAAEYSDTINKLAKSLYLKN